jgi:3-hydroxyisobutyrate dehydrogenase-like beta-hydroxyacid dehydrogenase
MVYDVRREPLEELARAGAIIADSLRAIGHHAEVIAICVLNDAQLEAVVFGPAGAVVRRRVEWIDFAKRRFCAL